jgi:riboflavin biosynthesis pyrimidine reductase
MLFPVPHLQNNWVSLPLLLKKLYSLGIRSIMVEGGARIISSFLENRLADQLVVSVTPMLLGGYRGVQSMSALPHKYMKEVHYQTVEDNLIVWGELKRDES